MKKILINAALLIAVSSLATCGPLQQSNATSNSVRGLFSGIGSSDSEASPDAVEAELLTRAFLEAQDVDMLRVSIISREATGLVVFGGQNGDKVTWVNAEGLAMVFKDGLLIGTRGFGDDLMGADLSGAFRSLNGGGNHHRTLDFLDGLDQIERRTFRCTTIATRQDRITIVERTYATTIYKETCNDGITSFENTYWRDGNGIIWQARQWISEGEGYLGYQRL